MPRNWLLAAVYVNRLLTQKTPKTLGNNSKPLYVAIWSAIQWVMTHSLEASAQVAFDERQSTRLEPFASLWVNKSKVKTDIAVGVNNINSQTEQRSLTITQPPSEAQWSCDVIRHSVNRLLCYFLLRIEQRALLSVWPPWTLTFILMCSLLNASRSLDCDSNGDQISR